VPDSSAQPGDDYNMSLMIDVTQDHPHWVFQVSGTYDLDEAVDRFGLVLAACKASGRQKVLIDYRNVVGAVAAVGKIIYTIRVAEQYEKYREFGGTPLRAEPGCCAATAATIHALRRHQRGLVLAGHGRPPSPVGKLLASDSGVLETFGPVV
jgi:hypothetical protein